MGSYEVTCNISNLPITCGTPVRVMFLGKSPYSMDNRNEAALGEGNNSRECCYSTDFWYPRMVPLKAKYYDYGQVNHVETGLNLFLFWEQITTDLWAVEQGPNPFHDPASSNNMDWDRMWDVVTEGRLRIKRRYVSREDSHLATPVCAVMIREDVWQAMLRLENPWEGYELENGEYTRFPITVERYKAKLQAAIKETLSKPVTPWEQEWIEKNPDTVPTRFLLTMRELFLDDHIPAGALGLGFYFRGLVESIESGEHTLDSPEIQDMIQRIAEVQHVKSLYEALRKTWHPGTGQGSQSVQHLATAKFHHAMAMVGYRAAELESIEQTKWGFDQDEDGNPIHPEPIVRLDGDAFLASLGLSACSDQDETD